MAVDQERLSTPVEPTDIFFPINRTGWFNDAFVLTILSLAFFRKKFYTDDFNLIKEFVPCVCLSFFTCGTLEAAGAAGAAGAVGAGAASTAAVAIAATTSITQSQPDTSDGEFQSKTTKGKKRKASKRKSVTEKKTADVDVVVARKKALNLKKRALALVTHLATSNATATDRAIDKILSEGGNASTKWKRWKALLKNVTDDQRELLDQAREKRFSEMK